MAVNTTQTSSNNLPDFVANSFDKTLLSAVYERNKTKYKWKGNLDQLKSFVAGVLKLSGVWSYTTNNGGFHVFKADLVTLSFYPGTQTLNIQGSKQKVVRKQLANYLSKEVTPKSGSVNQNGNDEQMNLSVNSEQMQVESSYKDDMGEDDD